MSRITVLKSKIHRATVTASDLDYEGSITLSHDIADAANLLKYEKVTIANINNGERFDTYVLKVHGKGIVQINGAAARKVQHGDKVIIMAYKEVNELDHDEESYLPTHVFFKNDSFEINEIEK